MRSYRKLILNADISGHGGNCQVLETTNILTIDSGSRKIPLIQTVDISNVRRSDIPFNPLEEHDYCLTKEYIDLTEYAQNVVTYMSGYVIKMLQKMVFCPDCLDQLTNLSNEDPNYFLINSRNLG